MNKQEWAQRIAQTANVLIPISIFLVMIWWRASLVLFSLCGVLYCTAWWMVGGAPEPTSMPTETAMVSPFRLHR